MKLDEDLLSRVAMFVIGVISFAAVSVYKITEQGGRLKKVERKLAPDHDCDRLLSARDVEYRFKQCAESHERITSKIFSDIAEIKDAIKAGESLRTAAHEEWVVNRSTIVEALERMEKKLNTLN